MTAINGAGLSGPYGDAILIYRETSILPSDRLLRIGQAVKSRYLLVALTPESNGLKKAPRSAADNDPKPRSTSRRLIPKPGSRCTRTM